MDRGGPLPGPGLLEFLKAGPTVFFLSKPGLLENLGILRSGLRDLWDPGGVLSSRLGDGLLL